MRAPGATGTSAIEVEPDELAYALNLDPYTLPSGQTMAGVMREREAQEWLEFRERSIRGTMIDERAGSRSLR